MGIQTGYKNSSGVDIGMSLVEKAYLIDRYPELADTFKQAGLWLVGTNSQGALGDNTTLSKSSPVQTIAAGTNWKYVCTGQRGASAIKTDGTLWLWGLNNYGQLGNNTRTNYSSPIQTIAAGTNWKLVSNGYYHIAAIKTDGTLWLWGRNNHGQLGNNNTTNQSSPVQTVAGGTNWKLVACGGYHTAAIKTDGTLWGWGLNDIGQLGNNSTVIKYSSPVQTVSGGTNWRFVTCGYTHTAAIKTDGTLWLWGQGQSLGNNMLTHMSSPVQTVAAGNNWKQVACGKYFSAAIKTDGTLWTWGDNQYGQIGDNTSISNSSPVQTIAAGTNWKQVTCGSYHVTSIKTDGTLWLWGGNTAGCLGINNTSITKVSSPVQTVSGGTNWKSIAYNNDVMSAFIRDDSADPI